MLRLLESEDQPPEPGWDVTCTPLGVRLIARVNSPVWDMCDSWVLLHKGRGGLSRTDPDAWFDPDEMAAVPKALIAELYASARRFDKFVQIIECDADARDHILKLPDRIFDSDLAEWKIVERCVELARIVFAHQQAIDALKRIQNLDRG